MKIVLFERQSGRGYHRAMWQNLGDLMEIFVHLREPHATSKTLKVDLFRNLTNDDGNLLGVKITAMIEIARAIALTAENIDAIYSCYMERLEKEHFSKVVTYDEIAEQDYNLSVSSYVEQEDTREEIDIAKLNKEIEEIVAREQVLRAEIAKIIAELEG